MHIHDLGSATYHFQVSPYESVSNEIALPVIHLTDMEFIPSIDSRAVNPMKSIENKSTVFLYPTVQNVALKRYKIGRFHFSIIAMEVN